MKLETGDITAVILAGGQGRRMGGQDKGLIDFNGEPLVARLIEQLRAQSLDILINANRNLERYRSFGYPVISDQLGDYQGPLAGFACAMASARTRYILTLPCDGPRLADDYSRRFIDSALAGESPIQVAWDGDRLQPVHALIPTALADSLDEFLASGDRKIDRWYERAGFSRVDFSDCRDMFANINRPEDRQRLETQP